MDLRGNENGYSSCDIRGDLKNIFFLSRRFIIFAKQYTTMLKLQTTYGSYQVDLQWGEYKNGRKALELVDAFDGEPVLVATVNLPDVHLDEHETIIKDYSENEGVLKFLQANKIVGEVKRWVNTGFVKCPVVDIL